MMYLMDCYHTMVLFIDTTDSIHDQLFNAAQYVKDLYQTDLGIVLLHENEDVYLAMYDGSIKR